MGAFAGPWPEWPGEDQAKQLVSVHVNWDVDKLNRALFGSSSAFGAALGEAWESKDYVETPWQDSEDALASGPAPAAPSQTVDADRAAGPTATGQARRTSFNELGWFGKKVRNEMVQRVVEAQPGQSYTIDEVACCSVTHGEKFRPIMRFQLAAEGAGSRLKVSYTIVYVQTPGAIARFGIQRAVHKDMMDSFGTLVDVLRKHGAVKSTA